MSDTRDAATIQPETDYGEPSVDRVPCLTIVCHPDLRRVGDRAVLDAVYAGRTVRLDRGAPVFGAPRTDRAAPLASRYMSASKSIELRGSPAGVELRPYDGARVRVDDAPVDAPRVIDFAALRTGVVIEIARRIALLLHMVEPDRARPPTHGMVGDSDALDAVRRQIANVADLRVNVLIRGDSGVGKERVATAIWRASERADAPFEACNMSSVPDGNMGLSALFGHVKGAFTGATGRFRGLLERNHGGTVFLDEIGACDGQVQDRLLRVLEDGVVTPVGTEHGHRVDVRVVSATDAALEALIDGGGFRAPLYHRLAQYVIDVPPLAARRDDIARLAVHFLREALADIGEPHRVDAPGHDGRDGKPWLPVELMAALVRHDWTGGNVRALANAIRRIAIDNRGRDAVDVAQARRHLAATERAATATGGQPPAPDPDADPVSGRRTIQPRDVSRAEFVDAFRAAGFSPARTAAALGRPKATIHSWMQQFGIRLVKQIERDELVAGFEQHGRDVAATARHFEVSVRSLKMRLRQLGIEVIPD